MPPSISVNTSERKPTKANENAYGSYKSQSDVSSSLGNLCSTLADFMAQHDRLHIVPLGNNFYADELRWLIAIMTFIPAKEPE
jgi:hypothetical protein